MVSSTLKKMYFWVFLTYHTLFVRIMGATLEGLKVLACATAQHTQSLSHWQMTKKHSLFFLEAKTHHVIVFSIHFLSHITNHLNPFTISDSFKWHWIMSLPTTDFIIKNNCKQSFTVMNPHKKRAKSVGCEVW